MSEQCTPRATDLAGNYFSELNDEVFGYYIRLSRVKSFVEESVTEPISLGSAAQVAGMEEKSFSKFFRRKAGVPFSHWLNGVRVAKATCLLKDRNYTITEVAFAVGFQDLTTFERNFKRFMSQTPFQYKKSVRPD